MNCFWPYCFNYYFCCISSICSGSIIKSLRSISTRKLIFKSLGILFITFLIFSTIQSNLVSNNDSSLSTNCFYYLNQVIYYDNYQKLSEIFYQNKSIIPIEIEIFFRLLHSVSDKIKYWNGLQSKAEFVTNQFNLTIYLIIDFYKTYVWYFVLINLSFFALMFLINVVLLFFKAMFSISDEKKEFAMFVKEASMSFSYSILIVLSFFLFSYIAILAIDFAARLLDMDEFDMALSIYNVSGTNDAYYSHIPNWHATAESQIDFTIFESNIKIFYVLGIILNLSFILLFGYVLVVLFVFPFYILFDWDLKTIRDRLIQILMVFMIMALYVFITSYVISSLQQHYYSSSLYKTFSTLLMYSIFVIPAITIAVFFAKHSFLKRGAK